jgi:hypothetical protein
MWGFPTACRDSGYHPSGDGIAIIDNATGWCVAELFPHQLYVHHDLCECNRQSELDILEQLLVEVLPHMSLVSTDTAAWLLLQFIKLYNREQTKMLRDTRTSIEADERTLTCLKAEVTQISGRLAGRRLKLTQLEGVVHNVDSQLAILNALQSHSMATAVKVEHGVIEVITSRLYAVDPRTSVVHRLGAQTITIHPDGKNGGVRYVSREGNISGTGRAIPHVTKEGFIAHPEALVAITELLALQKFDEVFDMAIQAATEVIADHTMGADIAKWPPATAAELIGTEWEGQQVNEAA